MDQPVRRPRRASPRVGTPANLADGPADRGPQHDPAQERRRPPAAVPGARNDPRHRLRPGDPRRLRCSHRGATTVVSTPVRRRPTPRSPTRVAPPADAGRPWSLTNKAWDTDGDRQAGQAAEARQRTCSRTGRPVIVVAVRDPYDVAYFTGGADHLVTYGTPGGVDGGTRQGACTARSRRRGQATGARSPATAGSERRPPAGRAPVRPRPDLRSASRPAVTVATYNIHAGAGEDNVFDLDRTAQALKALDADVDRAARRPTSTGTIAASGRTPSPSSGREARDARRVRPDLRLRPADRRCTRDGSTASAYCPGSRSSDREPSDHPAVHAGPESGPGPAPGFLEAEIEVRGRRVHVYCTHLDYRADPSVRALQVADTRKILAEDRTQGPAGAGRRLQRGADRARARRVVDPAHRLLGRRPVRPPAVRTPTRRSTRPSGSTSSPSARACTCGGSPNRGARPPVTTGPWSPTCRSVPGIPARRRDR